MLTSGVLDIMTAGGAGTFGLFKWIISRAYDHRAEKLKYKLARDTNYFKDIQAAREITSKGFCWTRRVICLVIVFVMFLGMQYSSIKGTPIYVEVHQTQSFLGHLFHPAPIVKFIKMTGFVIMKAFVQMLYMIVGFYCGSSGSR